MFVCVFLVDTRIEEEKKKHPEFQLEEEKIIIIVTRGKNT